ncbi:HAD family phosphatase [Carbonactinospora thermoautotrophica]|uniref:HAD-superfamily hydrolase n=1 Tax=Carbonactinospora thermoautotrophica TaxID=1469144 RepID=A0A132NER6_9ACTN|nr:HAD family phosphatase [Carbonactinospora thermoautotrophica]KWX02312.1 HAD-superfamily hydrolase [Carbonactinospora thermoautotrophica]KWX03852.1 haloacid dehalogenase [Carbonactinospora thermoautotrophica]KWX08601.1 haloacid dehalogenase [Carbonactinospora thermoautotrophica]MCX9190194.1 HAD family phosphatase [Carbonactinospora thermoautotrophica]
MSVRPLRALIVDWGGVLTTGLEEAMVAWCEADGIDYHEYLKAMREWLGPEGEAEARFNPIHALERGEIEVPHFEEQLAARLRTKDGQPVPAKGLIKRMFRCFDHVPAMINVVRHVHQSGIKTALLSNSWGNEYPREGWEEMFDAVVISGEVGMRKPEPDIYRYAADQIGCRPEECVFVDDLRHNVRGAVEVGMVGIHHRSYEETVEELEALFGLDLRAAS